MIAVNHLMVYNLRRLPCVLLLLRHAARSRSIHRQMGCVSTQILRLRFAARRMTGEVRLGRMTGEVRLGRMTGEVRLGRMTGEVRLGRMT